MSFWRVDHRIMWHGLAAPEHMHAHSIVGNNIMSALQHDFTDIFEPPRGLPPVRRQDHRIHLKPNTEAVAVRPYRYPQLQKDEIEKQCEDMLHKGSYGTAHRHFPHPSCLLRNMMHLGDSVLTTEPSMSRLSKISFPFRLLRNSLMNWKDPNFSLSSTSATGIIKYVCIPMMWKKQHFVLIMATLNSW